MEDFLTIVADSISAVASILTAGVAIYGVRIWKRELVGREVYEAVKDLVHQSHVVVRASNKLRAPIWDYERIEFSQSTVEHTTQNERWALSESEAYRRKLSVYSDALDRLSESLLQVRVLLGSKIYESYLPFQRSLGEPIYRINEYLNLIEDRSQNVMRNSEETTSLQNKFFMARALDDEMSLEISDARESAEKFLLPYLYRKSIRG